MDISNWMCWEGGVDLVALSAPNLPMPNVIVHLARIVHTPLGSTPAGLVMLPDFDDVAAPPRVMGFVAGDATIGAYFGPKIFAGTPFEGAPVLAAQIEVTSENDSATATVSVNGVTIKVTLSELSAAYKVDRNAGDGNDLPFFQQGVERSAGSAQIWVDGQEHLLTVPPIGLSGGPAAVVANCGLYGR